jgi:hypothetical protein
LAFTPEKKIKEKKVLLSVARTVWAYVSMDRPAILLQLIS